MKGVSPSCSKSESPKTPGGISKSLLTPCRRVGLSRKWKKGGCSPFVSPLSTETHMTTPEIRETNKRKKCDDVEILPENNKTHLEQYSVGTPDVSTQESCNNYNENKDITTTPSRNIQIPRKKSKTLSLSIKKDSENNKKESDSQDSVKSLTEIESQSNINEDVTKENILSANNSKESKNKKAIEKNIRKPNKQKSDTNVTKVTRTESKSKIKLSLKRSNSKQNEQQSIDAPPKEKSPNNLTKECIVVIQNKILKTENLKTSSNSKACQELDSEADIPLSMLKKENTENVTLNILNDDDFICQPTKEVPQKKKIRNLSMIKPTSQNQSNNSCQSSQEDDRRTILIKKTYNKVTKPSKAKSTGSITQEDINELKARIEKKKKLLMAKAMSIDTEELRELIKKWQKGCQNALMELLELMKKKLPDRQNMDYAEILETLKIPAELVGYDSDNDCFLTPDDTNVLLSALKL